MSGPATWAKWERCSPRPCNPAEVGSDIEENEKGLRALFRKQVNKAEALKAKYSKVETNVTAVQTELEKHQVQLLKDVDVLDRMYDLNLGYFKELTMYIAAGEKKKPSGRSGRDSSGNWKLGGSSLDLQRMRRLPGTLLPSAPGFEKKLYDLELTRTIVMQTAPQIRMVQASDTEMAEKIQSDRQHDSSLEESDGHCHRTGTQHPGG